MKKAKFGYEVGLFGSDGVDTGIKINVYVEEVKERDAREAAVYAVRSRMEISQDMVLRMTLVLIGEE